MHDEHSVVRRVTIDELKYAEMKMYKMKGDMVKRVRDSGTRGVGHGKKADACMCVGVGG